MRNFVQKVIHLWFVKIDGDVKHLSNFVSFLEIGILTNISVNFEGSKMVDHISKIQKLGDLCFKCFIWGSTQIVFTKYCRMKQRRYRSRHFILMFIRTPRRRDRSRAATFLIAIKTPRNYLSSWMVWSAQISRYSWFSIQAFSRSENKCIYCKKIFLSNLT